jgi:hypothetical protein
MPLLCFFRLINLWLLLLSLSVACERCLSATGIAIREETQTGHKTYKLCVVGTWGCQPDIVIAIVCSCWVQYAGHQCSCVWSLQFLVYPLKDDISLTSIYYHAKRVLGCQMQVTCLPFHA